MLSSPFPLPTVFFKAQNFWKCLFKEKVFEFSVLVEKNKQTKLT